jgi:hypothetical protein
LLREGEMNMEKRRNDHHAFTAVKHTKKKRDQEGVVKCGARKENCSTGTLPCKCEENGILCNTVVRRSSRTQTSTASGRVK